MVTHLAWAGCTSKMESLCVSEASLRHLREMGNKERKVVRRIERSEMQALEHT